LGRLQLHVLPFIFHRSDPTNNPFRVKSVAPILAFLLLFTILVQIKLSNPSRKQTLRFELIKSIIVTVLWVWFLISTIVGPNPHYSYPWGYALVNLIISFLFISYVYPRDVQSFNRIRFWELS
jgi:hypothetical protein